MSRDRCRAQKPSRQREPQTVVVTSDRGVTRSQVSSRVQISIRSCSLFFFLRHGDTYRDREGERERERERERDSIKNETEKKRSEEKRKEEKRSEEKRGEKKRREEKRRGLCLRGVSALLPCSLLFMPIPWSVSASVLCNFPSRRFGEYLRRDLEALINPARASRSDRRALPSIVLTNCRVPGPRIAFNGN